MTAKQTKVYLAIVRAVSISVSEIAKNSKVYQQDVYKILPKLEEMGLVTKTLDSPIAVRAINVEKALTNLVALQKKMALKRIANMETSLQDVLVVISEWQSTKRISNQEEPYFILLTKENEAMNLADELFEKASIQVDLVLSLELLTIREAKFCERFQTATHHGVRVRIIVEHPSKIDAIDAIVKHIAPISNNFAVKFLETKMPKPFQIIDHKEVWITRREKLPSGVPYVFWTNSADIKEVYEERFEKLWNDHKSILLIPQS